MINLLPGERIALRLERHPIVLVYNTAIFLFLLLAPIGFFALFPFLLQGIMDTNAGFAMLVLGGSLFYLFIWLFISHVFLDFFLDAWIVTTHRIINIEQKALFSRTIAEHELSRIQDVSASVKGIIPSLFGFGTVRVQTAGELENFEFAQVRDPQTAVSVISQLLEQIRVSKT